MVGGYHSHKMSHAVIGNSMHLHRESYARSLIKETEKSFSLK
jgi:hypothetical protein